MAKDFLRSLGSDPVTASCNDTRAALKVACVKDGEWWTDLIASRNFSTHTDNPATAPAPVQKISGVYAGLLALFEQKTGEILEAGNAN